VEPLQKHAEPEKLVLLNEYAAELEQHTPLDTLFQSVKRTWYGVSLQQVDENDGSIETFDVVVADYVKFLNTHPTEENLDVVDAILAITEKFRLPSAEVRLQEAFAKIQRESVDPDLRNLAEVLEGSM